LLTPAYVIATFVVVGLLFIPIGIVVLETSRSVVEITHRYDTIASCDPNCTVTINIEKDMMHPIYFYYQLTNYYQNHRRYVMSRADDQLRGINVLSNLGTCSPLEDWNGTTLYPCGLIANSFFNDSFVARYCKSSGGCKELVLNEDWKEDDIAWPSDLSEKFKVPDPYIPPSVGPNGQLPNVTNEHFVVWMRTAGLPVFKKLYARMPDLDLYAGDNFTVTLTNVYPVSSFDGEKAIVLSTTSWLGGKNDFLGYAYLVVGAICWLLAILFFCKHRLSPRELGDMRYFNWPGQRS